MTNSSVVLFLFFLNLIQNNSCLEFNAIDPEEGLCKDLSIDAAVYADDGIGYAFKGDFYWKVSPVSGISQDTIASYIDEFWPGLTGPIDAAFTTYDIKYGLITVFIKGNEWLAYKQNKFQTNGSTDNWPDVSGKELMSAFAYYYNQSLLRKDIPIYLIYDTDKFSSYLIQNINKPEKLASGGTYIKGKFLIFLFDPTDKESKKTLSSFVNASAVLTDRRNLTIFGNSGYCVADITQAAPLCVEHKRTSDVNKFYGCPRLPFIFRTTTSTTTPTTETTTTLSTDSILSKVFNDSTEEPTDSSEESIDSSEGTDGTDVSISLTSEPINDSIGTDASFRLSLEQNIEPGKKSNLWLILVIVLIVVIVVICFVIYIYYFSANNKKSKTKTEVKQKTNKTYSEDTEDDVTISSPKPGVYLDLSDPDANQSKKIKTPAKDPVPENLVITKDKPTAEADQILQSFKPNHLDFE